MVKRFSAKVDFKKGPTEGRQSKVSKSRYHSKFFSIFCVSRTRYDWPVMLTI